MNMRLEFWKNSIGWPNDTASFVFLARAVHAIGKSMFGPQWTGDEPSLEPMQSLPKFPLSSGGSAYFAHDLLVKHHPEFNRHPLKRRPKTAGMPGGGIPPSVNFTIEEWEAARSIVAKDHEHKMPGLRRFFQVRDRIMQLAEAELLITARRDKAGGDPELIPRVWWNSERIRNRFDLCQIDPDDPYSLFSAGGRHQWIFVTRESLMSCAGDAGSHDVGQQAVAEDATSLRSEQPANPQRRIAESQIEPAFKKWRDEQPEGYIPTEPEDNAHMRQFGVGRDDVRDLRKKFPRRKRGEKK
jgi:hypothetical protein